MDGILKLTAVESSSGISLPDLESASPIKTSFPSHCGSRFEACFYNC